MKKIKYVICDLDRTLLNNAGDMSEEQAVYIRELRAQKGFCFGFASGRARTALKPLAERIGLMDACDVFISNNGVDICDLKNDTFRQMGLLEVVDINNLLKLFGGYDFINVIFHNTGRLYSLHDSERIQGVLKMNDYEGGYHNPFTEEFGPTARVTLLFNPARVEDVKAVLAQNEAQIPEHISWTQSDLDVVDFTRKGISKAKAIETYISQFGDTMEQVVVFGDSANDIAMMEAAGVAVAMQNASEEVKAIADYITEKSNNEDGVMHFLKANEDWF